MPDVKLCECGCGQPAPIAKNTRARRGYVKGQPVHFIKGHGSRGCPAWRYKSHGMWGTPEYDAYYSAKNRCLNSDHPRWNDYGGRGIEFRFTSFEQFFTELGPRPSPDHSLDRMDNDGDYEPGNVHWATAKEQIANQRKPQKVAA